MIDLLKKVTSKIEDINIPYMLSGSLAMGFYTIQRTTQDIDLVVELLENQIPLLVESFQDNFYCYPPSIEEALQQNSMFNLIDNETGFKIDFIIRKNARYDELAFERREELSLSDINIENTKFWVISLEDLIIAKLRWIQELQSEKQINDIQSLLLHPKIDYIYLNQWIKNLNLNTFSINFNSNPI